MAFKPCLLVRFVFGKKHLINTFFIGRMYTGRHLV